MDILRAKQIVHTLANGIDPTTGEVFPEESVYNSPEVIRALFTVLEVLNKNEDPLRNAGKPWTKEEDARLQSEFSNKERISEIAKAHGRTYSAIESRLDLLGLKKSSFWFFKRKEKNKAK